MNLKNIYDGTWVALIEEQGHLDGDTCLGGYFFLALGVMCDSRNIPEMVSGWALERRGDGLIGPLGRLA